MGEPLRLKQNWHCPLPKLKPKAGHAQPWYSSVCDCVKPMNKQWQTAEELIQCCRWCHHCCGTAKFKSMDSVGQRRMAELHNGDRRNRKCPQTFGLAWVWFGCRYGIGRWPWNGLACIQEYADLGISTFIFSGYHILEESIHALPSWCFHLPLWNSSKVTQPNFNRPFGEICGKQTTPWWKQKTKVIQESA